jgi:hypothetical protein
MTAEKRRMKTTDRMAKKNKAQIILRERKIRLKKTIIP